MGVDAYGGPGDGHPASGDTIDPGVITYLLRAAKMGVEGDRNDCSK